MKRFQQYLLEQDEDLLRYVRDDAVNIGRIGRRYEELRSLYPYGGGTLYRGLNFNSPQAYLAFLRSIKGRMLPTSGVSSWSTELEIARDFAKHKKTYGLSYAVMNAYKDQQNSGERIMGFVGAVLKINVPAGSGIDLSKAGVGTEAEVILGPGTYHIEDIIVEKRYANLLKNMDFNQKIIEWANSGESITNEIQWMLKSRKADIQPETLMILQRKETEQLLKTKVFVEREPHSRFSFSKTMYPGQIIKVWVTYNSQYGDALELIGAKRTPVPYGSSVASNLQRQLKSVYKEGDKIHLQHGTLFVLKLLNIHAANVPILQQYAHRSYKLYNDTLRKHSEAGKDLSSAVYDYRDDLQSFMEIAGL